MTETFDIVGILTKNGVDAAYIVDQDDGCGYKIFEFGNEAIQTGIGDSPKYRYNKSNGRLSKLGFVTDDKLERYPEEKVLNFINYFNTIKSQAETLTVKLELVGLTGAKVMAKCKDFKAHKHMIVTDCLGFNELHIPNGIESVEFRTINSTLWRRDIKITGGKDLVSCDDMFKAESFNKIDLSGMDFGKVETMRDMFREAYVQELILGDNFKTPSLKSTFGMFRWSKVSITGNSKWNLHGVKTSRMFDYTDSSNKDLLDLSFIDENSIDDMGDTFSLDLPSVVTFDKIDETQENLVKAFVNFGSKSGLYSAEVELEDGDEDTGIIGIKITHINLKRVKHSTCSFTPPKFINKLRFCCKLPKVMTLNIERNSMLLNIDRCFEGSDCEYIMIKNHSGISVSVNGVFDGCKRLARVRLVDRMPEVTQNTVMASGTSIRELFAGFAGQNLLKEDYIKLSDYDRLLVAAIRRR